MTPSLTPRGVAALDEWMTHCVEEGLVPGLVTLVTTPDRVVYHEAAGLADVARRRAMPRDAIVRIASMTKPLTSAAFMTLVETGRVGLDDEVARYLPRHGGRRVLTRVDQAGGTFDTAPCSHPMTVRHVLTHTSGIGATWSDHGLALVERSTPGLDEDDLPLVHEPGARWTYGTGTKVLGDIAEVVTGLPIEAFLARTILEPVGMTETGFEVPEPLHRRVATLHQRIDDRRCETPNAAVLAHDRRGDGRLFSTADDYGRFLRMILNEGRVGSVRVLAPASLVDWAMDELEAARRLYPDGADGRRPDPAAQPALPFAGRTLSSSS